MTFNYKQVLFTKPTRAEHKLLMIVCNGGGTQPPYAPDTVAIIVE